MFVAHLQIEVGDSITAAEVKRIIAFVEASDWPPGNASGEDRKLFCRAVTQDARASGVFGYAMSFVNCGNLADLVESAMINHAGRGLIVNTRLQTPSVFFVADDHVRLAHINFDFLDYTRFLFDNERLRIMDLTEEDATLLRLSSTKTKVTLDDGTVVERIKR